MSDNKKDSQSHEDCGKFALNENGVLAVIMDVVFLGSKAVYLGIPVDSDENWASLKPRIVSGKLRPECMIEAMAHLEPTPKSNPLSAKIMYVKSPTNSSKPNTGDFLQDLLSGLSDGGMFGGPSMRPPAASDFEIDDPEEDDKKHGQGEDDGA